MATSSVAQSPSSRPHAPGPQASGGQPSWTMDQPRNRSRQRSLNRTGNSADSLRREYSGRRRNGSPTQRSKGGGQSMRVGNVTSRGLELCPVTRPLDGFSTPPDTPPGSPKKEGKHAAPGLNGRDTTFSGTTTSGTLQSRAYDAPRGITAALNSNPARPSLARSHSFSTIDGSIDGGHARNVRPLVDLGATALPSVLGASGGGLQQNWLRVPIPPGRMGKPQWKGSALLHSWISGSSPRDYSSSHSTTRPSSGLLGLGPRDDETTQGPLAMKPRMSRSARPASPIRRTMSSGILTMPLAGKLHTERMIDIELEIPPNKRHERAVVRLSQESGQVMAATPSGLVAQITSPNLLDYELLSDFFLTFRSYMNTSTLMAFLVLRLNWALDRTDDFGRIVRVRVFVAIRHWILNYFPDDFMSNLNLRTQFCDMVNALSLQLRARQDGAGDEKIVGELKKCWRRTCALYWDIPDHKADGPFDKIFPGGRVGSRNSSVDDQEEQLPVRRPHAAASSTHLRMIPVGNATSRASPAFDGVSAQSTSARSRPLPTHAPQGSDQSTHVVSCSLPIRNAQYQRNTRPAVPVPVEVASRVPSIQLPPSVARSRSRRQHLRTASFTDTLHEVTEKQDGLSSILLDGLSPPSAILSGSLVRGALILPTSADSGPIAPPTPTEERSSYNFVQSTSNSSSNSDLSSNKSNSSSNPGVRRFLGSVRRALSSRDAWLTTRGPGTDSRGTSRQSPLPLKKPASTPKLSSKATFEPRIDVLAEKSSVFLAHVSQKDRSDAKDARTGDSRHELSTAGAEEYKSVLKSSNDGFRMYSAVTQGSRSIVIVDATGDAMLLPPKFHSQAGSGSDEVVRQTSQHSIPVGLDPSQNHARSQSGSELTPPDSPALVDGADYLDGQVHAMTTTQTETDTDPDPDDMLLPSLRSTTDTRSFQSEMDETASETTVDPFNLDRMAPQLKRRPGGDLRGATHVRSLGDHHDRGSLRSSESGTEAGLSFPRFPTHHDGQTTAGVSRLKEISLLNTHSSQPMMRPSFEMEVAKLAGLPDDDEDDGGAEATLRKLEGRYERSSPPRPATSVGRPLWVEEVDPVPKPANDSSLIAEKKHRREEEIVDNVPVAPLEAERSNEHLRPTTFLTEFSDSARGSLDTSLVYDKESGRSTPLLERGLEQSETRRRRSSSDWLQVSLPSAKKGDSNGQFEARTPPRTNSSSWQNIQRDPKAPQSSGTHKSFLLDDNQSLSEPMPLVRGHKPKPTQESFFIDDSNSVLAESLMAHPLRQEDTPPKRRQIADAARFVEIPPPVLDYSSADGSANLARGQPTEVSNVKKSNPHLPFILGYSSLVLAQQFTIIEKDALSEVDWRELIDLRWKQSSSAKPSWGECLGFASQSSSRQILGGVDICIERFNLMVKWVASEIVLCERLSERVACVVKYIHVAQHARRLQNWATMFQITMALISSDISRLKQTWQEVPHRDNESLKNLEALIMPTRNFHNIRMEMEAATAHVDVGCIPFLGLYTHDLTYNAQKPALAERTEDMDMEEPLINFERHRAAAAIVKDLLRMLDASSKYAFEMVPEVASKCLWTARLDDEEISRRSRMLEPETVR